MKKSNSINNKVATLAEVAKEANVSTSSVSMVLSGKCGSTRVGKDTRKRILKIAKKLGYSRHVAASQLKSGCTDTIGVLMLRMGSPFYGKLLEHLLLASKKDNLNVTPLLSYQQEDCLQTAREALLQRRVDGVIDLEFNPVLTNPKTIEDLPIVAREWSISESQCDSEGFSHVSVNYCDCFYELVEALLDRKRKNFSLITNAAEEKSKSYFNPKVQLFIQAMKKYGINKYNVLYCDTEKYVDIYKKTTAFLRKNPKTDVILIGTAEWATAVYSATAKCERSIGDDLSVASWTDTNDAVVMTPSLTVMDEPHVEVAKSLYELIKQRITGSASSYRAEIKANLILRESL